VNQVRVRSCRLERLRCARVRLETMSTITAWNPSVAFLSTREEEQHIAWTRNRTERLHLAVVSPKLMGFFVLGGFCRLIKKEDEASLTVILDVELMKSFRVRMEDARTAFEFATNGFGLQCQIGKGENAAGFLLNGTEAFGENEPPWSSTPWASGFRCEFTKRAVQAAVGPEEWMGLGQRLECVFGAFAEFEV